MTDIDDAGPPPEIADDVSVAITGLCLQVVSSDIRLFIRANKQWCCLAEERVLLSGRALEHILTGEYVAELIQAAQTKPQKEQ